MKMFSTPQNYNTNSEVIFKMDKIDNMPMQSLSKNSNLKTSDFGTDTQNYNNNEHQFKLGELESSKTSSKTSLQCNICGLIISNKWNFTLHMRVHNNDRRYKCSLCSSSFITAHDLKKHTLAHNGVKPRFKCQFCPKTYSSRHSKYLHEDSHNKVSYNCRHCSEIFSKFVDRRKHEKKFHMNDNAFFSCSECNKKFTNQRFLENHERNYHKKEINGFKCEECSLLFETSSTLNIHRRTHTIKSVIINETDSSGMPSNTVKVPVIKKKSIELYGIKIHECIVCTKCFTSRGDMLLHMATSHPEENKAIFKFHCNICKKSFKSKQSLSQHFVTHVDEKKFNCSICEYKSKRRADLKVHMRKHTGESPYICEKCGHRFQQIKSLQHHKKQHYGKIFKCNISNCDASYYRKRELDWHKQKHSEGGFKCPKCDKMLAHPYSLKSHLQRGKCHSEELTRSKTRKRAFNIKNDNLIANPKRDFKRYECFACGYASTSTLDLTMHHLTHRNLKGKHQDDKTFIPYPSPPHPDSTERESVLTEEHDLNSVRMRKLLLVLSKPPEKTDYKGIIALSSNHQ